MNYWKNGFYDEPQESSVEITEEYYQELLAGQSAGLLIVESKAGVPVLQECKTTIREAKAQKLDELRLYDSSEEVNQFSINKVFGWFNKSTRVGLANSINIEREVGRSKTNIWLGDTLFILPIEKAIDMLCQLELYALTCYNVTQGHINIINQLETKESIEFYDFRIGYPKKLSFTGYPTL